MNAKGKMRKRRNLCALSAAVAACSLGASAKAQTAYSTYAVDDAEIKATGSYTSGGLPSEYFNVVSTEYTATTFGVVDFNAGNFGIPQGQTVTGVGTTLSLNMTNDQYYYDITDNATMSFYLTTDANTSVAPGTTAIEYETPSDNPDGLNNPGDPGSFAAGSTLYFLGTGIYNDSSSLSGTAALGTSTTLSPTTVATNFDYGNPQSPTDELGFQYTLNLPTAADAYIESQINSGQNLRLVMTINYTGSDGAGDEAAYLGSGGAAAGLGPAPTLSLNLTTSGGGPSADNSTLWVQNSGNKSISSIDLGRVIQGTAISTTFTLGNSGTDTLQYVKSTPNGYPPLDASTIGTDPLAGNSTTIITVGFSASDTAYAAGAPVTGNVTYSNASNPNDTAVTIELQTEPVFVRYLESNSGTLTPNFGKVLVGTTASMPITFTTTNPQPSQDANNINGVDYSTLSLTKETLLANVTASPYSVYDEFGTTVLGTLMAVSPNTTQTFLNTEVGTVTGMVAVAASGVFGGYNALTINGHTRTYTTDYADFENNTSGPENEVQGENLPGETNASETVRIYEAWVGYSTASLAPTSTATLLPGGTGSIYNAMPNDNIYTYYTGTGTATVTNTYSLGIRAQAWVTTVGFNQTGWSQTGLTPVTLSGVGTLTSVTSGTTITALNYALSGIAANAGATAGFTIGALDPTGKLGGTYTATMSITAEDELDITGTTSNDLGTIPVANVMGTVADTPIASGIYTLNGGGFTADPDEVLSGAFIQSGGTSTFPVLNGNGTVSISNSSTSTIGGGGSFTGQIINNGNLTIYADPTVVGNISGGGSLTIAGTGTVQVAPNSHTISQSSITISPTATLDITNNTVSINFGSNPDPITSIVAALSAGYAGGWTGAPGASGAIVSSTAAANNLASASPVLSIGYSDGNYDPTLAANAAASATAGQILIKMTLAGDAYLNGSVNFNDLDVLGRHYNTTGNDWAQGNFNYAGNGAVNFNDLDIIGLNYNQNIGSLGSSGVIDGGGGGGGSTLPVGLSAPVSFQVQTTVAPEPSTIALMTLGASGLLARRRAKRPKPPDRS